MAQLTGISSMATQRLLAELGGTWARESGAALCFESVGGVDAEARVASGEGFDLVVLAAAAMLRLRAAGRLRGDLVALASSPMAIAIPVGGARPDVSSAAALREALLAAPRIAYSSGPSGTALMELLQRWDLADATRDRLVRAHPGVPVAALLAAGQAQLGFQQLSELRGQPGIDLLGTMPAGAEVVTRFLGAVSASSRQPDLAQAALDFMAAPEQDATRRAEGMSTTTTTGET